jgi:hypothetical protein
LQDKELACGRCEYGFIDNVDIMPSGTAGFVCELLGLMFCEIPIIGFILSIVRIGWQKNKNTRNTLTKNINIE